SGTADGTALRQAQGLSTGTALRQAQGLSCQTHSQTTAAGLFTDNASRTFGAIFVPKISIDFMRDACDGPPTSMCAERRVNPNISCIWRILSTDSFTSPLMYAPSRLRPKAYCCLLYGGHPRLLPPRVICAA